MATYDVMVMEGDGIGPEVVGATVRVMEVAARTHGVSLRFTKLPVGLAAYENQGSTLPQETIKTLQEHEAWLLGPVTHHIYDTQSASMPNPSGYLRKNFELYSNVRPARSYLGVSSLRGDVDLVIVRENTEGFYADRNVLNGSSEMILSEDMVVSLRVISRKACTRVAEHAFALAKNRQEMLGRQGKVTALHKANVLRHGDGLFLRCCKEVAGNYPDIIFNDYHADAFAMHVLKDPTRFDVIVTTNLFGDILSDLTAGLVGGLGLAPGINVGADHAMAQATHGSAPDIANQGIANPVAEILSGALLLEWLGLRHQDQALNAGAEVIREAVAKALQEQEALTPDLGGAGTTASLTQAIVAHVESAGRLG